MTNSHNENNPWIKARRIVDSNHRQYIFLQPECIDLLKKTVCNAVNNAQAQDETTINAMTTLMLLIEPSSQQGTSPL